MASSPACWWWGECCGAFPGLPLIQMIVVSQIINGILLPFLLVFILRLVNDRRIMGAHVNSRLQNIIGVGTASLLAALSAVMLASISLPAIGIPFLQ